MNSGDLVWYQRYSSVRPLRAQVVAKYSDPELGPTALLKSTSFNHPVYVRGLEIEVELEYVKPRKRGD